LGPVKESKQKCRVNSCLKYGRWESGICLGCERKIFGKKKKPKKKSEPKKSRSARDKAKDACQKYCRLRDADKWGRVVCITCNKVVIWNKNCDGSHYRPASKNATCFDERNVNGSCKMCNKYGMQLQEVIERYAVNLDQKWGPGTAEEIKIKSHMEKYFSDFEYEQIERYYKDKFEKLKEERLAKGWVV